MTGSGTALDPYIIYDVTDLQNISLDLAAHYELGNDIDASATVGWNLGAGFIPVGVSGTEFTGTFDGKGYTISDLFINRPATNGVALFGYTDGAAIRNGMLITPDITGDDYVAGLIGYAVNTIVDTLPVTLPDITGDQYVGALIGRDKGSTVTNSPTSGGTVDGNKYVGGLMGATTYATAWSIDQSSSSVAVTASADNPQEVGGLIGYAPAADPVWRGNIARSASTGSVTVTATAAGHSSVRYIGAFVGRGGATMDRCYTTASVSIINNSGAATSDALEIGGMVGFYWGNAYDCFSLASLSVSKIGVFDWDDLELGGFVGEYDESLVAGDAVAANCYFAGTVTIADVAGVQTLGGFCADASGGGLATNCFWDTTLSGLAVSDLGTGKTTAQMKAIATFLAANWDFSQVWSILAGCNMGYPCLIDTTPGCAAIRQTVHTDRVTGIR